MTRRKIIVLTAVALAAVGIYAICAYIGNASEKTEASYNSVTFMTGESAAVSVNETGDTPSENDTSDNGISGTDAVAGGDNTSGNDASGNGISGTGDAENAESQDLIGGFYRSEGENGASATGDKEDIGDALEKSNSAGMTVTEDGIVVLPFVPKED